MKTLQILFLLAATIIIGLAQQRPAPQPTQPPANLRGGGPPPQGYDVNDSWSMNLRYTRLGRQTLAPGPSGSFQNPLSTV